MELAMSDEQFFADLEAGFPKLLGRAQQTLAKLVAAQPDQATDLVDLGKLDGKTLAEGRKKRLATYGTVPFDPAGDILRLYPGGLTVWSGHPGTGKTTLLRQLICQCLARGSSVFLASLEEDSESVITNLAATAAACDAPSAHQVQWFLDSFSARFRLWSRIGITDHRKILALIRSLAAEGIKHAVIDSLMCLDVANDKIEEQRQFANRLIETARSSRIHIHLVAHPRKPLKADLAPEVGDVAGAKEIGAIADNVIFVRRAKDESAYGDSSPMVISIRKQRHGSGRCGEIVGWYRRNLKQFSTDQFAPAVRYLPEDAYT